jgi:hypothetical protein
MGISGRGSPQGLRHVPLAALLRSYTRLDESSLNRRQRSRREQADIEHRPIRKKNAPVGSLERHDRQSTE